MRFLLAILLGLATTAAQAADVDDLPAILAAQVKRKAPVVVQLHVALCDNQVLECGGRGLGDGDNLRTNLYWGTSEGFAGWMQQRESAWHLVKTLPGGAPEILQIRVYRRGITPSAALRALGVTTPFDAYLVAFAWRGKSIDDAIAQFAAELFGDQPRVFEVDGVKLQAGAAAQIVGYVGHNRWMDRPDFPWRKLFHVPAQRKGVLAVACYSRAYLKQAVVESHNVPLLFTNDFVMASSGAALGAINVALGGGSLEEIRRGGANGYAAGQHKVVAQLSRVFVNPAAPKW
jgi:hypothetical protein